MCSDCGISERSFESSGDAGSIVTPQMLMGAMAGRGWYGGYAEDDGRSSRF